MLNVLIAGIGGQGSVLAAKILAAAAQARGWKVRTAETIGMAQRGGNVTSHVRMGDAGEEVHAPLIARGTADCVIALEAGEAVRALPYLAPDGLLVCAQMAGQLTGGMLIDSKGWLGCKKIPVTPKRIGGVLLVAAGVLVISLFA